MAKKGADPEIEAPGYMFAPCKMGEPDSCAVDCGGFDDDGTNNEAMIRNLVELGLKAKLR